MNPSESKERIDEGVGSSSAPAAGSSREHAGSVERQTIWREGDRLRRTDSTGYGDMVSDDEIREHIRNHGCDPLFATFAEAVLAIRAFERTSEAVR